MAYNENVTEDSDNDDRHIQLTSAGPMEIDDFLRQDNYQQVMHHSNATLHCTHILGSHELDLAYH